MTAMLPLQPAATGIADELDALAAQIEDIGAGLCADPEVVRSHAVSLQNIDLVAQTAKGLAHLLRADCKIEAISSLGLEALQERLSVFTPGQEEQ